MDWYDKLSRYFPEHEMKHPEQIHELLNHHDAYQKMETGEYIATYAEFPKFVFIDYLLVNPNTRGRGLGTKVLDRFKQMGKTIIVEVEPVQADDEDTARRVRFYEKNGFTKAEHIEYIRSDEDGQSFQMDIYYWSEEQVSERTILQQIAAVCTEIHNFKSLKYYGRDIADPDEVLNWVQ